MADNKILASEFLAAYEQYYSAAAILERIERKRRMAEIEARLIKAREEAFSRAYKELDATLS